MPRLRQRNAQNYVSSQNINAEFENVIRYLNAAELGDKTIGELFQQLFDAAGAWAGPVQVRLDSIAGLQYRVGAYDDESTGWIAIAKINDLRGPAGEVIGEIGAPIMHARHDVMATDAQTVFDYAHAATDELLVYVDGVLQVPGGGNDYLSNDTTNTVTFNTGVTLDANVTFFQIRKNLITGYTRVDFHTRATQTVFPFPHNHATVMQIYQNGILQRAGGAHDYTTNAASDTITFIASVPAGNTVTVVTVENAAVNAVTGLMTESRYADLKSGLILFNKLAIKNGEMPPSKISGLVSKLNKMTEIVVSPNTPPLPRAGNLWLDTSQAPNLLKFHTGAEWQQTTPESNLPAFKQADAGKLIQVNNTGTGFIYAALDLSAAVAVNAIGAANGVAGLDNQGRLPAAQLPKLLTSVSEWHRQTGAVADGAYLIKRVFKQRLQIDGISLLCNSGAGVFQLLVNDVAVGSTYTIGPVGSNNTLTTPQQIDASNAAWKIGYKITDAAALNTLEVTLALSVLAR